MRLLRVYLYHTERNISIGAHSSNPQPKKNQEVWWTPELDYVLVRELNELNETTAIKSHAVSKGEHELRFFLKHKESIDLDDLGIGWFLEDKPIENEKAPVAKKKASKKVTKKKIIKKDTSGVEHGHIN